MEDLLNGFSVPAIAAAVYWIVNLIKYTTKNNATLLHFIPLLATVLGVVCGLVAYFAIPGVMPTENLLVAIVIGGASGLSATGFNQIVKQINSLNTEKETQ